MASTLSPSRSPTSSHGQLDVDQLTSNFQTSVLLQRLFQLHTAASTAVEALEESQKKNLREYYKFALIRRRRVVANVPDDVWKFDLRLSLSAVLFGRERVELTTLSSAQLNEALDQLISALCKDISEPWFHFAEQNSRSPVMIAMPPLPGINLGLNEERFYVQGVSDTWPTKTVSAVEDGTLVVSADASCRFVDNQVCGDLGGLRIQLSEHELSYLKNLSIGWISRYESESRSVTIIELDAVVTGELSMDSNGRNRAHALVKTKEQRLDMYSLTMQMHEDDLFRDNFVLSRLLILDHLRAQIQPTTESIDIGTYIYVDGSQNGGLGPVDEEVFIKSLGSKTAKNKLRSALALGAKTRLIRLVQHGDMLRDVVLSPGARTVTSMSRMIRCGTDGIVIRTNAPVDTIALLSMLCAVIVQIIRLILERYGTSLGIQMMPWAVVAVVAITWTYHQMRYMGWSLVDTARLRRECNTDEQVRFHMTTEEYFHTLASAGAAGLPMDGIMSSAFTNSSGGKFSVGEAVSLEAASEAGLVMRVTTALTPVWIDARGMRRAEIKGGLWVCGGPYEDACYLNFTVSGPNRIGGVCARID